MSSEASSVMVAVGGMQNKAWAEDTNKFGYRMLMKMGWSAGKGVGKELQGQAAHVVIKKRSENLGLGCSQQQTETTGWSHTSSSFADILATLNKNYTQTDQSETEKKKKKKKKKKTIKSEKKTSAAPKRILYHKRIGNKNAKSYSAKDLAGILGQAVTPANEATLKRIDDKEPIIKLEPSDDNTKKRKAEFDSKLETGLKKKKKSKKGKNSANDVVENVHKAVSNKLNEDEDKINSPKEKKKDKKKDKKKK